MMYVAQQNAHSSVSELVSLIKSNVIASHFNFVSQGIFNREKVRVKQELLARMPDKKGNMLYPAVFIPMIDDLGLKTQFDYKVIEKAFAIIAKHRGDASYAININPSTFENDVYFLYRVDQYQKLF